MHDSLTIALLQAREAAMSYFRPIVKRHNLTEQQWRMERDGLVLRLKPINDQRKLYISLTKEGQALYNRAQTQIEEAYRQIEAQFTAEKMQQLTHLLEEFIALGNSRQEDIPGDNE